MEESRGGGNPGVVSIHRGRRKRAIPSIKTGVVKHPPDPPLSSLNGSLLSLSTMDQGTSISGLAPKFPTDSDSYQRLSIRNLNQSVNDNILLFMKAIVQSSCT